MQPIARSEYHQTSVLLYEYTIHVTLYHKYYIVSLICMRHTIKSMARRDDHYTKP